MTKVWLDSDEWYPVYSMRSDSRYGYEVEASDEQIARWRAAHEAFDAAQKEMAELHNRAADTAHEERERLKAEREAAAKAERDRVAAERRAAKAERDRKRDEMWNRIKKSGGHVYDADGNQLGTVRPTGAGVSTGVEIDPE